jgi:hypothetical protein
MKKTFFGYYRPNVNEFKKLWENCVFILDTNVLLDLYRYPVEAHNDLMMVLKLISNRLWVPYQVALEYQENRLIVIAEQVKKYDQVKKVLRDVQNDLNGNLDALQLKKRHSAINPENFLTKIDDSIKEFQDKLDKLKKVQPDVFKDDTLRDEIDTLLEGKVGPPPESQDELNKIYNEGEIRFKQKRPPGYRDIDKIKQDKDKRETYLYGGLTFERKYGDLILWKQIIKEAEAKKLKYIIFITNDDKEDWWWISKSNGDNTIGPKPELIEEIHSKAGVSLFYMYNTDRFLEFSKMYLGVDIKPESINQARDIAQISKSEWNCRDDILTKADDDYVKTNSKRFGRNAIITLTPVSLEQRIDVNGIKLKLKYADNNEISDDTILTLGKEDKSIGNYSEIGRYEYGDLKRKVTLRNKASLSFYEILTIYLEENYVGKEIIPEIIIFYVDSCFKKNTRKSLFDF